MVDPSLNALHVASLRGPRSLAPTVREVRQELVERACSDGLEALDDAEKRLLLSDGGSLAALHHCVWRLEIPDAARSWGLEKAGPASG